MPCLIRFSAALSVATEPTKDDNGEMQKKTSTGSASAFDGAKFIAACCARADAVLQTRATPATNLCRSPFRRATICRQRRAIEFRECDCAPCWPEAGVITETTTHKQRSKQTRRSRREWQTSARHAQCQHAPLLALQHSCLCVPCAFASIDNIRRCHCARTRRVATTCKHSNTHAARI